MKYKLKHFLSIFVLSIAAATFAQTDNVGPTYWIRPVKAADEKAKVREFTIGDTTYYLPVGVYVQVYGKNNGDIILDGKRLETDKAVVTVPSRKREISQAEFDKAKAMKNYLSVINDSLLAVNLKDVEGTGHINIYVRGQLMSSTPEYGKNDTIDLQALNIRNSEDIIILAQDSLLSTYAKVEELQKVRQDYSIPGAPVEEEKEPEVSLPLWLIIVIIAAGVALVVVAITKRGWIKSLFSRRKNEISDKPNRLPGSSKNGKSIPTDTKKSDLENAKTSENQNANPDKPFTPGDAPEPVKPETIEEKVAQLEKENSDLKASLKSEKEAKENKQSENDKLSGQLDELKKKQDEIIKKEVQSVRNECKKHIDDANARAKKAQEKADTIADKLNKDFNRERETVKAEKKELNEKLSTTRKKLQDTTNELLETKDSLSKANRKVENLTAETTSFHEHLSGVPDSKAYCCHIVTLLDLAKKVQESATALLKADIEDKYYIYKALALYTGKLDTINLTTLYTDVEMISKTGFVIKGTPLATYDQNLPKAELQSLTKNYFFSTYLKIYFDALVVLNESMAGLNYLVDDISPADLKAFAGYRGQIEAIAQKLGINILTVKIYDSVGSNIDLLATEVDAGIEKHGAILEIENCKVSLIGGAPDTERIIVKIQK